MCSHRLASCQTQNDFMRDWLPFRSEYLHELLNAEGRGSNSRCSICNDSGAQIALKVQYSAGIAVSEVMDPFLFIDFNSGMENASSSLHYLSKALSCILVMEEVPALCHLI